MDKDTIKILIVEDEIILAHTIEGILEDFGFKKIKIKNDYTSALEHLQNKEVSLAVLDINLDKGMEGLELAKYCFLNDIPFFYVSSYNDPKTLDLALETAPGAYVVKPVQSANLYSSVKITLEKNKKNKKVDYYSFKDGINYIKLAVHEILFLKADGIYTEIYTKRKKYLNRQSITSVTEALPDKHFIQTHRSYSINVQYLNEIRSSKIIINNYEIPISRTFKSHITEVLNSFK